MLFERPYTRLTRARLTSLAIGSLPEKPSSLPNPPTPSSSSSAPSTSSSSFTSLSTLETLPQVTAGAPSSQRQQKQQKQQREQRQQRQQKHQRQQRKQQKQPKQEKPKLQAKDKNEVNVPAIPLLPSPEPTKITSVSPVDPVSDDTADTASIAPNTPEYSSSSEPSRPVAVGQQRTRGAGGGAGGATVMLEVDTYSHHYSPSPYRTPTWSPESTSNQQADVALQELLGRNHQEEGRIIDATGTQDPLLSPLSLLSAVASVVGNRIGSPGLSNLEDLATCESLRSLSAGAPAINPSLNRSTTLQNAAMGHSSHEKICSSSMAPVLLNDAASLSSVITTSLPKLPTTIPTTITSTTGLAPIPRKRGRPPKKSNPAHYSSVDGGRPAKLSAIAPRPSPDSLTLMLPRQRSDTPGSTSSLSSLRHKSFDNRLIMPTGDTAATTVQPREDHGQPGKQSSVKVVRVTPSNSTPRLKHNRKPNPDGAIWSAAELAAETSAERRPARAIVYADEHIKQLVEGNRICIMEPCFRMPVREDLYCFGLPDDESGQRHEHGGICIQEKARCRIVLAFRYRYQLKLDTTYLAWVSTIDMETIPVSVIRDFSANREAMRQALEGEERMLRQYRELSDAGYFTPSRKEDKRNQDSNPGLTLDGWSIAHQNNVLMASMSNRLGFLQWVAQAYQMAIAESRNPAVTKTVSAKKQESIENPFKRGLRLALTKKMKLSD